MEANYNLIANNLGKKYDVKVDHSERTFIVTIGDAYTTNSTSQAPLNYATHDYYNSETQTTVSGTAYTKSQVNELIKSQNAFTSGYFINGEFREENSQDAKIIAPKDKGIYLDVDSNVLYRYDGADYIQVGGGGNKNLVEVSQETTIHFRKEVDYGTDNTPLSQITFNFTDAKRDVIQCVYFNGQELPTGVSWLNGSNNLFRPNVTYFLVFKWVGGVRILGNLNTI